MIYFILGYILYLFSFLFIIEVGMEKFKTLTINHFNKIVNIIIIILSIRYLRDYIYADSFIVSMFYIVSTIVIFKKFVKIDYHTLGVYDEKTAIKAISHYLGGKRSYIYTLLYCISMYIFTVLFFSGDIWNQIKSWLISGKSNDICNYRGRE